MRESINSALAQTYQNIEIIVINDGSTDDGITENIAQSYGERIRYYVKENGGVATALNYGIELMTGDYFSWLSHDDLYTPNKIEEQVIAALAYDYPVIVYSDFSNIDSTGKIIQECKVSHKGQISTRCLIAIVAVTGIHGCSLLIPRIAFERYGKFRPELKYTQDYDLWFTFASVIPFIHVEQKLVLSRQHDQQDSKKYAATEAADALHTRLIQELDLEEVIRYAEGSLEFMIQAYNMYFYSGYVNTASQLLKLVFKFAIARKLEERATLFIQDILTLNQDYAMKNWDVISTLLQGRQKVKKGLTLFKKHEEEVDDTIVCLLKKNNRKNTICLTYFEADSSKKRWPQDYNPEFRKYCALKT